MKKLKIFNRCPKTGRIIGFNSKSFYGKILFPIFGILAIVWFLFRVLPKPDRIAYPCQKVALSVGGIFLTYLSAIILSYPIFTRLKRINGSAAYLMVFLMVITGGSIALFSGTNNPETFNAILTPPEGINNPMGVERGIFPGRVTWVQDFDATSWDGESGNWWDDSNTDQQVTDQITANAIMNIAGENHVKKAWESIFRYHNQSMGKGKSKYKKGEKIVIKVNLNPLTKPDSKWEDRGYPSPQMLNSLVKQLVDEVGINGKDIQIVDPSRCFTGPIDKKIRSNGGQYLDIKFVGADTKENDSFLTIAEPDTANLIFFNMPDGSLLKMCLPMCFSEADYIIDFALLRPHRVFGITNVAKNHYGSVWDINKKKFNPGELHAFALWDYPTPNKHGDPHSSPVLLGHKTIHDKTILYLVDGLYTAYNQGSPVKRFSTMNNEWLSSLFVSLDPVALESVCCDLIQSEPNLYEGNPGFNGNQDSQLHECALANNPPSNTKYDPENDGTGLQSLGVHEHWNNPADKKYGRNLGAKKGIELIVIDN